ncbi:MAG: hypothetical protein EXS32_01295 [Opitutus sp.]|nr:hypothetical protein [Opitutus sp.]
MTAGSPKLGWALGLATCLVLAGIGSWDYSPPLPRVLELWIKFPAGVAGRTEPLISTGVLAAGDFFTVTYRDATTAVFGYDSWGVGGPSSSAVKFEADSWHLLRLEMPALTEIIGFSPREKAPLRIHFDGREILAAEVSFHARAPSRLFFASNPVGGDTPNIPFRGELLRTDGRRLAGGPDSYASRPERLVGWLTKSPGQAGALVLLSLGVARALCWLLAWWRHRSPAGLAGWAQKLSRHRPFILTGALCATLFAGLVTDGSFRFQFPEVFGIFYDYQAASLLHGRLDVPAAGISGEAFVVDGKHYGYFGVTPALLRLPFVILDLAFGQLSRSYLLVYYVACLLAAYRLLGHATRIWRGRDATPSGWATVILIVSTGLGSSLFFLGSRAYIYHEAILCGAAFALWSIYGSLRYLAAPGERWWLGALVCGIFSMHARPTSGLFALCVLGGVALTHLRRRRNKNLAAPPGEQPASAVARHLAIGVLSVVGLATFSGLSYLKFGTFDGSPLRYSVQYSPERLARFEGRNFHLANLRHNLDTYVFRPTFRLEPRFPYYYFSAKNNRADYPEAKMDLLEATLGFPYAMPGLFVLALAGGAWAGWCAAQLRPALVVLWLGVLPMAAALFTAVVTSHRYTADFCPFFVASAVMGLAVLDTNSGWQRPIFLGTASLLTVLSVAMTLALSLHFQGQMVWGVPTEVQQNYQHLQQRVDAFFGSTPK